MHFLGLLPKTPKNLRFHGPAAYLLPGSGEPPSGNLSSGEEKSILLTVPL